MNLLFHHKQTYVVNQPVEEMQSRLRWIVTRRWEDYSMDLVGRLYQEGKFSLRSKWPLVNIEWIDNNPGYIRGVIAASSEGTEIKMVIRPNKILVALFYIATALLCLEIANLESLIPVAKNLKIAFLAGVNVILLPVIIIFRDGVRKRFEELMRLS
jgi:hypothetical protein